MRTNKAQKLLLPSASMSTPGSLANLYAAKSCKGGRFKMGTCQLRERTMTEKHRSTKITGGWRRVDNPTHKCNLSQYPKKRGQGPHRAAERMMMMMMFKLRENYTHSIFKNALRLEEENERIYGWNIRHTTTNTINFFLIPFYLQAVQIL
jgi:hypothetical protein